MAKKMTMADIANLSGVGKSTVSRYFNGGYVKDETRAKIQKVRIQLYTECICKIECETKQRDRCSCADIEF